MRTFLQADKRTSLLTSSKEIEAKSSWIVEARRKPSNLQEKTPTD